MTTREERDKTHAAIQRLVKREDRERADAEAQRLEEIRPDVEKLRKFGDLIQKTVTKAPACQSAEAKAVIDAAIESLWSTANKLKAFGA